VPNDDMEIKTAIAPDIGQFMTTFQHTFDPKDLNDFKKIFQASVSANADLVDYLSSAEKKLYDQKVAATLSVASAWAYSDVDMMARMMRNHGIPSNQSVSMRLWNDALLSDTVAHLVQSKDGQVVILAFGGTLPTNVIQLLLDVSVKTDSFFAAGAVHGGIFRGFVQLWPMIAVLLKGAHLGFQICAMAEADRLFHHCYTAFSTEHPPSLTKVTFPKVNRSKTCLVDSLTKCRHPMKALYITGHSLGGALAVLAAALIHSDSTLAPLRGALRGVYTFGQPMVGDANFAKEFQPRFGDMLFRHVYRRDVVPHLPPRSTGRFVHFGHELTSLQTNWEMHDTCAGQALLGVWALAQGISSFVMSQFPPLDRVHLTYSLLDHSPLPYLRTSLQSVPGSEFMP
jgi:hypothetical protein